MSPTKDPRDKTPEPPAYLDPFWVLRMRKRLIEFAGTGDLEWYKRGPRADWSACV